MVEHAAMDDDQNIITHVFADDGTVPNNRLPLVVYRGAIAPDAHDPAAAFERTFAANGWSNGWRDGIYPYHHFHSIAHEVLGVARGSAIVRFGGEGGIDVAVSPGDVVVIPAGVGHKRLSGEGDLLVVGAYPGGSEWDLVRAGTVTQPEYDAARKLIAQVPLPRCDPVMGADGPLLRLWTGPASE
jgi:uncharacterized protein YjlB